MSAPDQIPVIDISRLENDPAALRAIDSACREWGFFQIVGHGIPQDIVRMTHASMRAFFALPVEAKRAIERTAGNPWGFFDKELTKNTRDWKQNNPPHYRGINWGEFRAARAAGDYADHGDEIQILTTVYETSTDSPQSALAR